MHITSLFINFQGNNFFRKALEHKNNKHVKSQASITNTIRQNLDNIQQHNNKINLEKVNQVCDNYFYNQDKVQLNANQDTERLKKQKNDLECILCGMPLLFVPFFIPKKEKTYQKIENRRDK